MDPGRWTARTPRARRRPMAARWRHCWRASRCFRPTHGRFRAAIDRADGWLASQEILTITDASVCLLAGATVRSAGQHCPVQAEPRALAPGPERRRRLGTSRQLAPRAVRYGTRPPGTRTKCDQSPEICGMIARGRAFLVAQQQEDGSWIETTRPPGNVSYAQRISTTGWATLALLATRELSATDGADPKR